MHQQGSKYIRLDCPGQVGLALGQVKIGAGWPSGQMKLASVVLQV